MPNSAIRFAARSIVQLLLCIPWLGAQTPIAVEIHWDEHNVPYVISDDDRGVIYGQGHAQGECFGLFIKAEFVRWRGQSSAFYKGVSLPSGMTSSEESDLLRYRAGVPQFAEAVAARMTPRVRTLLQAFCDGYDAWVQSQRSALLARWTPILGARTAAFLDRPSEVADVVAMLKGYLMLAQYESMLELPANGPSLDDLFSTRHSNAWAFSGAASAGGLPRLFIDPHIEFDTTPTFVSALLGKDIQTVGMAVAGTPFHVLGTKLARGHVPGDRILSWAVTAGPVDSADLYEVPLDSTGARYRFDNRDLPFAIEEFEFERYWSSPYRGANKWTVHGRVILETGNKAYALRTSFGPQLDMDAQLLAMGTARDHDAWRAALDRMSFVGGNNFVFVSNELVGSGPYQGKDIAYYLHGPCPDRSALPGGAKLDWTNVVDGSSSKTLWRTLHTQAQLPSTNGSRLPSNRPRYLINNNCGLDHTDPGIPDIYPRYVVLDRSWSTYRQERAEELVRTRLLGSNAQPVDTAFMLALANDTQNGRAVDGVTLFKNTLLSHYASFRDPKNREAWFIPLWNILDAWQSPPWPLERCSADPFNPIAPLYYLWIRRVENLYGIDTGLERPNFFQGQLAKSDAQIALLAMLDATEEWLLSDPINQPWGSRRPLLRVDPLDPNKHIALWTSGAPECLRAVAGPRRYDWGNSAWIAPRATGGQTCPMIVELGSDNASTRILYSKALDNCSNADLARYSIRESRHWSEGRYRQLLTTRAAVRGKSWPSQSLRY
jgi:hypothetical protein